ncbi:hypothetical protein HYPSUDRAFT_43131 [Hypholoma sublateritium FD-334 SS-4]|uniref:Sld7 C-terminal domain-containing protein n=1 Tax=Hypholoma sublateritium (strain FD-334 SS-4) TaxID=945553 RepID=A0A0D2NNN2_HYPSF|nr:hypothetical protein HYPSUDRAFT_43131 [Hypholoma sublateritium FD-334 SS-4]
MTSTTASSSSTALSSTTHDSQRTLTPTKAGGGVPPAAYRLLYRGALALPDSLMLLDGLTFGVRLDSPVKPRSHIPYTPNTGTQSTNMQNTAASSSASAGTGASHLLENPLALALESMRGRPTLRLLGPVKMGEVYLDESGRVEVDIHPLAALSHIFFENTFCLLPFASHRSETGLKIALGDSDGPETTEIVIFAERSLADMGTSTSARSIRLHVGRVAVAPRAAPARAPRPDDPIPRRPPAFFIRDLKRTGSIGTSRDLKRTASSSKLASAPLKRQKTAELGSSVRLGAGEALFKVPELPVQAQANAKGKGKERDVFGEVAAAAKGKQRGDVGDAALEKANRNVIKRLTIEYLGRARDPADPTRLIDKTHPEFKDLYGYIYRGVGFALRGDMRTSNVELNVVNRLIDKHALMYLPRSNGR